MNQFVKTSNGIVVCRRCENCGTRVQLVTDNRDRCVCKCERCGKEYRFSARQG